MKILSEGIKINPLTPFIQFFGQRGTHPNPSLPREGLVVMVKLIINILSKDGKLYGDIQFPHSLEGGGVGCSL